MLPPLPEKPTFPVYGLDRQFSGTRWLILWNDPRFVWTVSLGHGRPNDGNCVDVTTIRKREPQDPADVPIDEQMPLLYHAALDAIHVSVDRLRLRGAKLRAAFDQEFRRLDVTSDGGVVLDGWQETETVVDDRTVTSYSRILGRTHATVLELPQLAVSVLGPTEPRQETTRLVDVSDHIDDYLRLSDEILAEW